MKNIKIKVPHEGVTVQLMVRPGGSDGQAVIAASDDVEILLVEHAPAPTTPPRQPVAGKVPAHDLDFILKRLAKLKPATRAATLNSIKAMFQLTNPISDRAANKILADLQKRGSLTIDANDRVQIRPL